MNKRCLCRRRIAGRTSASVLLCTAVARIMCCARSSDGISSAVIAVLLPVSVTEILSFAAGSILRMKHGDNSLLFRFFRSACLRILCGICSLCSFFFHLTCLCCLTGRRCS